MAERDNNQNNKSFNEKHNLMDLSKKDDYISSLVRILPSLEEEDLRKLLKIADIMVEG